MSNPTPDQQRYLNACHAIQTGVASTMEFDPKATEPKHLRTGVNIAMCDLGSLVELLVAKGLITMEEYHKSMADGVEKEVASYEKSLSEHYGANIKLA